MLSSQSYKNAYIYYRVNHQGAKFKILLVPTVSMTTDPYPVAVNWRDCRPAAARSTETSIQKGTAGGQSMLQMAGAGRQYIYDRNVLVNT